jgi:hypothetical protein
MTTTAILPDDLELHEGEEFVLRAVAKNGALMITRVISATPEPTHAIATTKSSFTSKWGSTMAKVTDPEDTILSHINAKHVK